MFLKNLFFVCLTLMLASACNVSKNSTPNGSGNSEIVMSYARGACFGRCPVYQMTVLEDGAFTFEAKRFMEPVGVSVGSWDTDQWEELKSKMDQMDWAQYQEYYDSNIPDLPSTTIRWRGKEVSFKETVPKELEEVAIEIHDLIMAMDKGQMIYQTNEDHMSTRDLIITLRDGCTIDREFQTLWADTIESITPLTEEIGQYLIRLKPYTMGTGEAYTILNTNACISKVQIQ